MEAKELLLMALEGAYGGLQRAVDGLSDEQLFFMPAPQSNSIAWLAWHLSRWKDRYSALLKDEPQVWLAQGWAGRLGLPEDATGTGDDAERVLAFRPPRDLLFGYVEAAHRATVDRIGRLASQDLERTIETAIGPRPGTQVLRMMLMDFAQHTGQIAYIRGMLTGLGWSPI